MKSYEPYSGEMNISEIEGLFKSDADFHWEEEPWAYKNEHYRSYGNKGLPPIENVENLTGDLSYGELIRVMAMKDEDISDLDDPEFEKRYSKEAGPTVSPNNVPSNEIVLQAVKEAWGNYSTYESAKIIEKDSYNHFIVRVQRDANQANDIIQYVAFDQGGKRYIVLDSRLLLSYSSALRWDREPTTDEWIKIFEYDSLFHWGLSLEAIPNTESYRINGFDDYIHVNYIDGAATASETVLIEDNLAAEGDREDSGDNSMSFLEEDVDLNIGDDQIGHTYTTDSTEVIKEVSEAPEYTDTYEGDGYYYESGGYPLIGKTNRNKVNVREEMNKRSKLLITIKKKGTSVTVLSDFVGMDNMVWYQVEYEGVEGYIRSDFIVLEEPKDTD